MGTHNTGTRPHNTLPPYSRDGNDFIRWFATCQYDELYECVNSSYRVRHFKRFKYGADKKLDGFVLIYCPASARSSTWHMVRAGFKDPVLDDVHLGPEMTNFVAFRRRECGFFNSGARAGERSFFNKSDDNNPDSRLGLSYHQWRFQSLGLRPLPFMDINRQLSGREAYDTGDWPLRILEAEVVESKDPAYVPCSLGFAGMTIRDSYAVRHLQGAAVYRFGKDVYLFDTDQRDIRYGVANQFLSKIDVDQAERDGIDLGSVRGAYQALVPREIRNLGIEQIEHIDGNTRNAVPGLLRQGELVFCNAIENVVPDPKDFNDLAPLVTDELHRGGVVATTMFAKLPMQLRGMMRDAVTSLAELVCQQTILNIGLYAVMRLASDCRSMSDAEAKARYSEFIKELEEMRYSYYALSMRRWNDSWVCRLIMDSVPRAVVDPEWDAYEDDKDNTLRKAVSEFADSVRAMEFATGLAKRLLDGENPDKVVSDAENIRMTVDFQRSNCIRVMRDMERSGGDDANSAYFSMISRNGGLYGNPRGTPFRLTGNNSVVFKTDRPWSLSTFGAGVNGMASSDPLSLYIGDAEGILEIARKSGMPFPSRSVAAAALMIVTTWGGSHDMVLQAVARANELARMDGGEVERGPDDTAERTMFRLYHNNRDLFFKAMTHALSETLSGRGRFAYRMDGCAYAGGRHWVSSMVVHSGHNGEVFPHVRTDLAKVGTPRANARGNGCGAVARGWVFQNDDHVPLHVPNWSLVYRNEAVNSVNFTGKVD